MNLRELFRPRAFIDANWVMITFASVLHMTWAVILTATQVPIRVTPLWGLSYIFDATPETFDRGDYLIALVLAVSATAAIVGGRYVRGLYGLSMMLPQQMILFISASGVAMSVARGVYADGTVKSISWILVDQMPILLAAPLYTVAILTVYNRKRANE